VYFAVSVPVRVQSSQE